MDKYIKKLEEKTPEFMKITKDNKEYLLLEFISNEISKNNMAWLFNIYLREKYKILDENKITEHIKNKYKNLKPDIINDKGNLFINEDLIKIILTELYNDNQIILEKDNYILK